MSAPRPDITAEKIIPMLETGFSVPEIAQKINCGVNIVYSRARQAGFYFVHGKSPKKNGSKNICGCCGLKPVPKKPLRGGVFLTRTCADCYYNAENKAEF